MTRFINDDRSDALVIHNVSFLRGKVTTVFSGGGEEARSDGAVTERPTVLIHLINHLLQLFRSGILAQHPHHLPQFFSADAAIFCILNEDVKRSLELCKRRRGC